ncbi:MAG TPA: S41 family peptidase [Chitinophagales bacterium]|nr:hypothetical protein [Chitinophagales bacterium]HMZ95101.1 S41 family peptidase [Chitinophagales bacterium]HNC65139.1 S41 family peptidase [Chitinophagales bacterium]HND46229.1 S41 family peptidase [Chitinophagales bacterium]HNE87624.1 S41 family peptidase [Chitinophagales bacterium]
MIIFNVNRFQVTSIIKIIVLYLILGFNYQANAQTCQCKTQFEFVYSHIETNNPAYQVLKTDTSRLNKYLSIKEEVLEKLLYITETDTCLQLINKYINSIEDHHTGLFLNKQLSNQKNSIVENIFIFKELRPSIAYIKLGTFSRAYLHKLNMLYDSSLSNIEKYSYLILDLRDNCGGSDEGWHRLLPIIYTNKFQTDKVDFWASKENIEHYFKYKLLPNAVLEKLRQQGENTFHTIDKGRKSSFGIKIKLNNPKKIIILQNRKVASATEDFILMALQSKKVITIGENTGGYTGYGNVRTVYTPDKLFILNTTTTKYQQGSQYEFVGIPPIHYLQNDSDWIEMAMQYFK